MKMCSYALSRALSRAFARAFSYTLSRALSYGYSYARSHARSHTRSHTGFDTFALIQETTYVYALCVNSYVMVRFLPTPFVSCTLPSVRIARIQIDWFRIMRFVFPCRFSCQRPCPWCLKQNGLDEVNVDMFFFVQSFDFQIIRSIPAPQKEQLNVYDLFVVFF